MQHVRPSSAAALAIALASSIVFAQTPPPAAPPAAPPASAPASTAPAKTAPANTGAAEAAAPAKTAAPAPAPAPAKAQRPARGKRARKVKGVQAALPQGPVATYPGFRMLPDGSSRVFVQVSKKVDVTESKAEGRVVYRMKGANAIQTNHFALVTSFFPTPVGKVQLVDQGEDLDMVIELRAKSDVQHRVFETERGMVLQVDFPALPPGTELNAAVLRPQPGTSAPRKARRSTPQPEAEGDDTTY